MKNLNRNPFEERETHHYEAKVLPFRKTLNGISQKTLENHHDKLYLGYVNKKNEIENRLEELGREIISGREKEAGNTTFSELRTLKHEETYAANGVYLHEWYFDMLGGDGKHEGATELTDAIQQTYGSVETFIKYFSECGMSARGWTVLAWDTREGRLWVYNCDAHNQGGIWGALPIIVLDVYEHAYFIDFGADRKKYFEAFWKNFNWAKANELYNKASAIRL